MNDDPFNNHQIFNKITGKNQELPKFIRAFLLFIWYLGDEYLQEVINITSKHLRA